MISWEDKKEKVCYSSIFFRPTFSRPDIIDSDFARGCFLQSFYMSVHEISDVDIITYAGAVMRFIVCSFDLITS